jgi:hypothetical protein
MALRGNIEKKAFGQSVIIEDVYAKVINVQGDKDNMDFRLGYMKDGVMVSDDAFFFVPDLDGTNFIQQCYEHLKGLDAFSSMEDC